MRVDRHDIPEKSVDAALAAVPEELGRQTRLAQYGGAFSVEMLADMLLDYAAARTAGLDPRLESRDTWLAITSAAALHRDYALAVNRPEGAEVRAFVDYLGVGFGFEQESRGTLAPSEWIRSWHLALLVGNDGLLGPLSELAHLFEDDPYVQALVAHWASEPVELEPSSPEGEMLRAIVGRDAAAFNAALVTALERHRERAGRNPRDLIAWGPLALAALAHDAGLPIEVESGYLPERLYTRAGPARPGADGPVARPDFDTARAAKWLEDDGQRTERKKEFAFNPDVLLHYRFAAMKRLADDLLLALSFRAVIDPRAEQPVWRDSLVLASEATASAFRLASVPQGTAITVPLAGRAEELPACGPVSDASDWVYARAAALMWIVRSSADSAVLAAFDVDDLHRTLPDTNAYARACHAVLRGEDPRPHLRDVLAAPPDDPHGECLRHPRVRLLDRIAEDDADGFNTVLAEALGLYRDYYSAGDNIGDPDGQLHLDALGLACLAHDRGIPVRVESDYLPRTLVEGLSPR
ncbi:immunity 49 family protein [Actinomadura gamaensis]|uniref:Imm49 family immunity protein n=1 Tax=Actinomadura gamaensis TaxID=1763541 RepID=A0ABV9TRG7_9ACTN